MIMCVCMYTCLKQQEVQDLWFMVRTLHQADEERVRVCGGVRERQSAMKVHRS